MNNQEIDRSVADKWDNVNWATDEDWVRAAASLEAETGVDILIGADLGNNLDLSRKSISSQIDMERLAVLLEEGLTDLLSPAELTALVAETHAYINDRVYHLKFVGEAFLLKQTLRERNENRSQSQ
jgi:hypothetical protein